MLAESCFEIMHRQLGFNMGKMPSSYMLNSEMPEMHEALSEELQYASRFWASHLTHLQKEGKVMAMTLAPLVDDFLNNRFLYWLEAVSILRCFQEAMEALSILKLAKVSEVSCI
jgi:hypothetical protein